MIEIEMNGSVYEGRLCSLEAQTESFCNFEGIMTYRNYGYHVVIMDANGVQLHFHITSLTQITFLEG